MKVLCQFWTVEGRGTVVSISKDRTQYEATLKEITEKGDAEPEAGDPIEVTIPDDCAFPEMLEDRTVFLNRDEELLITFPT